MDLAERSIYNDLISYIVMPDHVHGITFRLTDFYYKNAGNGQMKNAGRSA